MSVYIKLVYCFIAITLIQSCSPASQTTSEAHSNPLDAILGDKMINEQTGEIRVNNFSDFSQLSEAHLQEASRLYNVSVVKPGFYALSQKKLYEKARLFSAVLAGKSGKVVRYQVLHDFQIIDQSYDTEGIYLLQGNYGSYNRFWPTQSAVQLIKFDNDLNPLWTYQPNAKQSPLEAQAVTVQKDYVSVIVDVMTGCGICFNRFEVKIDNQGNCFSAIEISTQNSSAVFTEEMIAEIFHIP